ncbi:MAG: DEAD/DEAH box helicase [Hydrogenophaga sp.]|jgi:ATP-dependent RNA helicase RhlE|uniref:DEAD/DEAH box helicase n=2 Tax=Hydrogenophaga sp. TaxID=1904254 RepID=UPI002719193B|nr:DEAD/DEAH box helicase [Hydrogenophaga sp.]MDO9570856.1 DEAD/DEAH box helicase [Hydrogenophaga sp.]MDP3806829.1 DEAD/DEAH box helicase [Hydrogenophaga sp.]MDZ4240252.1 DEAD/DEAH box helicase [Hydrogenophaga sp.]
MNFDDLKLAPAIVQAVREHGYETPTPIQAEAIPAVLAGRDLLGGAQTGTGKTAAFTLPLLHRLSEGERAKNRFGGVAIRALVLTPTRELAAQVEESVRVYGKHLSLTSTVIFGGVGMNPQINAMKRGVDILVATPGRLLDLQQQGFLDLSGVQMLVLDEADRMLDMGFIHDVKKILALVPKEKQSLLFSATFSDEIRDLANNLLKDPLSIQVTPRNTTVQRITQVIHPVGRGKKKALLVHIINQHNWSQVLVFTRTKFGANNVAEFLTKNGIQAMALHGNKSQGARTQALAGFKSGDIRALVATDIAARGIDIDELPHVVNYEIPNVSEDYVHRIGRTGRAGKSGEAVNLVSLDEEGFMMDIERFTKQQIPVQMFPEFMPEPGEKAEPIAMGRQTIWGGAGKPPSRDVMAAAAKAARTEMMQRVREKKADAPQGRGNSGGQRQRPAAEGSQPEGQRTEGRRPPGQRPNGGGAGNGQPRSAAGNRGGAQGQRPPRPAQGDRMDRDDRPERGDRGPARGEGGAERQPGPNAHLGSLRIREPRPRAAAPGGQPDPLRTSIDSLGSRGARNNRPGQGRGGPGRNSDAPRGGPADPLRTNYGRIR